MKKINIFLIALSFIAASCDKSPVLDLGTPQQSTDPTFVLYTIYAGKQYSDRTHLELADYKEQKFIVKFDSSAIYSTIDTVNQGDINKLFGFADNDSAHARFSARFGWAWFHDALGLYAYVYNNGVVTKRFLSDVAIGKEHYCAIKVLNGEYIFTLNKIQYSVPRTSTTLTGKGYKLYPYFGGDEFAPHNIKIWINELPN